MTPILAKVTAIEKRGDQYQVIVQISPKYRGSFNTLAFGEIKPHSGSFKDGRLDLVYHQNPGFNNQLHEYSGHSSVCKKLYDKPSNLALEVERLDGVTYLMTSRRMSKADASVVAVSLFVASTTMVTPLDRL